MIPGLDHCFNDTGWVATNSAAGQRLLNQPNSPRSVPKSIATPSTQVAIAPPETTAAAKNARSDWLDRKASYYLKLIQNLLTAGIQDKESGFPNEALQQMRRHEIKRLSQLRDRILEELKEL